MDDAADIGIVSPDVLARKLYAHATTTCMIFSAKA